MRSLREKRRQAWKDVVDNSDSDFVEALSDMSALN